jgi:nucleotidyltransferase/DNA polymerase involved in DNA repair
VVLSNNDGCIVALTPEVKALGVKMGTPYFENREVLKKNHVHVFSSNYALYGDMSRRVMQVIARFAPAFEIYSIDECFLQVNGITDLSSFGRAVSQAVLQETGIPCGVGIGRTKTLAKIANRAAKKPVGNATEPEKPFVHHQLQGHPTCFDPVNHFIWRPTLIHPSHPERESVLFITGQCQNYRVDLLATLRRE